MAYDQSSWVRFLAPARHWHRCTKKKKVVRPNFDVVFVIDRSGSMSGQPLRDVLSSVKSICDEVLKPNDGIGIITFESSVSVLAPLAFKPWSWIDSS